MDSKNDLKTGLLCAFTCYLIWGFISIYWELTEGAGSWEVIAHRIVWTPFFILLWVSITRKTAELAHALKAIFTTRLFFWVFFASGFACVNWWVNVIAVFTNHVIELGIGLFMTPLFSVLCGIVFFRERLTRLESFSVALALAGLVSLLIDYGSFPWIAFGVSSSWAVYGTIKKKLKLDGTYSVMAETLLVFPFAFAYLVYLHRLGVGQFSPSFDTAMSWTLIGVGLITVVPMITFGIAAVKLPLTILGFFQYINPILTLLVGVFYFSEPVTTSEIKALAFILPAIAIFVREKTLKSRNAGRTPVKIQPKNNNPHCDSCSDTHAH